MNKPLDGEILPPGKEMQVDHKRVAKNEARVRSGFWTTFKKAVQIIPFSNELVAAYYCALDPETPFHARATLLAALAYFVLPIDIIPDFILGLGFSDDITVLAATLLRLRTYIKNEHRDQAADALND